MRIVLDLADLERIDRLARRLYGSERGGTLEALLAANPGLAALALRNGCFLPRGTMIAVPLPTAPAPNPALTRPWE